MENLVSIIMPLYNGEKFIKITLESVLKQTYKNWELLITNDGSKDSSPKIVEEYAKKDERIKLFNQINRGSAAARNNSLKEAKGKYIVFLDSDDIWEDNFLEKQIKFLKEKNASLVFSSYRRINEEGKEILDPFIVPEKVGYKNLLKTCSLTCLTSIYDREKTGIVYFNEKLKSLRDDYVMWLTMLKKIDFAYGNKEILARYRIFSNSTTGKKFKVLKPQFLVYYKIEKLGFIKSLYYFINWIFISLKKYKK